MRKWIALVLCVLALCLAISVALADSWDFLHSAFRLTSSADMERLAAENGLTLTQSDEIGQRNFLVGGITFRGLTPTVVQVYRSTYSPFYDCKLIFDADANGSESVDLKHVYIALLNVLIEKYGSSTTNGFWYSSLNAYWNYGDATISLIYVESSKQSSVNPYILLMYDSWSSFYEPDPSKLLTFPYPATNYAAKAHEEASQPFSFRNGVQGGMTMDQVIAAEGRQPDVCTDGSLTYSGLTIDGRDAALCYWFVSETDYEEDVKPAEPWLAYAEVHFDKTEADENAYVAQYEALETVLKGTFGPDFFGYGQWYVPRAYEQDGSGSEREMCTSWMIQDVVIAHILEIRGSELLHGLLYTFYDQPNCEPDIDVLTWPEDMLAWGD